MTTDKQLIKRLQFTKIS